MAHDAAAAQRLDAGRILRLEADPIQARPPHQDGARLGLPEKPFLFLTLFDLNSYAERKNPRAALAAFRDSGLPAASANLVVKVQNLAGNEADFARLQAARRAAATQAKDNADV